MRIYTCTPVAFGGGADFFARDSGLLCRGFQMIGIDSRAVMPGERKTEDEADLIRTEFRNLESADWWKSQQLDGVMLYAWGRPKFRRVAAAIHEAGIFLVLNQDNGGLISPLAGFRGWWKEQQVLSGGGPGWIRKLVVGMTYGLGVTDPLRASHLKQGDVIACVSPEAARHYRRLCHWYGGEHLVRRVKVVPHAVEPLFCYDSDAPTKARRIACVGRWQDRVQKRPELMQAVLDQVLENDQEVRVDIVGEQSAGLDSWHRSLSPDLRARIELKGRVARDELAQLLARSQVFYSPSAFESFGIAAGEALCSGCSVVAGRSPSMASFEWFVSEESGTLACSETPESHAAAINAELKKWQSGERCPTEISGTWCERLHADKVAARLLEMMR